MAIRLAMPALYIGATGVPGYRTPPPRPSNLVNYVEYGDVIGNFASGMSSTLGFAPASNMDHVGTVQMVGTPSDGADLKYLTSMTGVAVAPAFPTILYLGLTDKFRDHFIPQYTSDISNALASAGTSTQPLNSPLDVVLSLDNLIGTLGVPDSKSASLVSATVAESTDFSVSINTVNSTVTLISEFRNRREFRINNK